MSKGGFFSYTGSLQHICVSTMTDKYQEFDHSGKSKTDLAINSLIKRIHMMKFRRTEICLGITVLICIIGCVILVALLAASKKSVGKTDNELCLTGGCLRGASFNLANMNASVKPCDDFYQYACGGFQVIAKLDSKTTSKTAHDLLRETNMNKVRHIVESPLDKSETSSAKKKIKEFYKSCMDTYQKEKAKGTPMLTTIIPNLGGWYVLGDWTSASWDFQDAFVNASRDFAIPAFFRFVVAVDRFHRDKRVIEVINNLTYFWKTEEFCPAMFLYNPLWPQCNTGHRRTRKWILPSLILSEDKEM